MIGLLPAEGHRQGRAIVQLCHMLLLRTHGHLAKPDWLGQLVLCGLPVIDSLQLDA